MSVYRHKLETNFKFSILIAEKNSLIRPKVRPKVRPKIIGHFRNSLKFKSAIG